MDLVMVAKDLGSGLVPASLLCNRCANVGSSNCACRKLSLAWVGGSYSSMTATSAGEEVQWLGRPHCWQGSLESESAFL